MSHDNGVYMHPDLYWLARNVSEWGSVLGANHIVKTGEKADYVFGRGVDPGGFFRGKNHTVLPAFTKEKWLKARKDLGLDSDGISEPDEEDCLQLAYERMNDEGVPTSVKQLRYMDAKGEDWIDEFARTASVDEFRGAMKFTIGKYNRRAGKKDELIKEIEKMRDYCDRWIEYERSL